MEPPFIISANAERYLRKRFEREPQLGWSSRCMARRVWKSATNRAH
jgi:hypothetical protein